MSRTADIHLIDALRQKIQSGGFDKTTFLPSERKLAAEYQVGRGIIRGALKYLTDEGVIYTVPRRGFRIKKQSGKRLKRIIVRLSVPVSAKAYEAMGLLSGICAGANELFSEIILSTPPAKLQIAELQERYNADDIQGIIFLENASDFQFEEVIRAGIPAVIANLEEEKDFPGVRLDYRGVGRIAGAEILQRDYQRIGVYSGPTDRFLYREILAGFRGVLAEENLQIPDSMHIVADWNESPQVLRTLLMRPPEERPEVLFTLRDYRAAQVYALCDELSIRIPEDLGVISFDGISWPGAEKAALTTIAEETIEIGRQAVYLLQKQFEFGYDPVKCMVCSTLIPGNSLRPPVRNTKIIYHQKSDI